MGVVSESLHGYLLAVMPGLPGDRFPDLAPIEYLEEATYRLLMVAWLLGMLHVWEQAEAEMADFSPEPLPMEEAVEQLKSRVQMPASEFYQLDASVRFRAFTVARIAGMDAITRIKEKIEDVLEEGETLEGFIAAGRGDELLERAGFSKQSPWYWETVYRTNTISAYNAGRWSQMSRIQDSVEYVEFVAIIDPRTTEFCRVYNGVVRRMDDPIWSMITPPNHFNCRSTIRPLMKGTHEAVSTTPWTDEKINELPPPQEGFEASPLTPQAFAQIPESMWSRARQYGLTKDIYKAAERAGVILTPAAAEAAPPLASIPLDVKTRQDMVDIIKERLGPMTNHGITSVEFTKASYFMGTNSSGRIFVSSRKAVLPDGSDFTPSRDLLSAFKGLGRRNLTFNEEYALECLWHELNHNRQVTGDWLAPKKDLRNVLMETVNQWFSRRTYPEMLDRLGGFKPRWQKEIIASGPGYASWVNRLDRVLARAGLTDKDILEDVRQIHQGVGWMDYLDPLAQAIADQSGKKRLRVKWALKRIRNNEKDFQEALERID